MGASENGNRPDYVVDDALNYCSDRLIATALNRLPNFRIEYDPETNSWIAKAAALYGHEIYWKRIELVGESGMWPHLIAEQLFYKIAAEGKFVAFREGPDWWHARWDQLKEKWEIFLRDETPIERPEWAKVVPTWKRPEFEGWPSGVDKKGEENRENGVVTPTTGLCRVCSTERVRAKITCIDGLGHVWS